MNEVERLRKIESCVADVDVFCRRFTRARLSPGLVGQDMAITMMISAANHSLIVARTLLSDEARAEADRREAEESDE